LEVSVLRELQRRAAVTDKSFAVTIYVDATAQTDRRNNFFSNFKMAFPPLANNLLKFSVNSRFTISPFKIVRKSRSDVHNNKLCVRKKRSSAFFFFSVGLKGENGDGKNRRENQLDLHIKAARSF
jgi:hypothetical protein